MHGLLTPADSHLTPAVVKGKVS
ncbi:hypothetical protein E2C01_061264 [Portunus trituberculatus]|uniref:Uncharacterized protein n=1 Tax=Portunus trituberculatus TaxID=210409 RepID=A0A5B7HB75_PORTR|nr:hypothetical protein [Portunus trituberculatus]